MPCTYCSNPKHTRKQCQEITGDYKTYLSVSEKVRQGYTDELFTRGITPNATVRTYNRTGDFMKTSSEVKVVGIGPLDMFNCYLRVGRQTFANKLPTTEHIILGDDDDRMVGMNHCYEVVQSGDNKWSPDDFTVPLMSNDEFLAMFKGKKRHVAFEKTLHNCVVKKYVDGEESVEEMIARVNAEIEKEQEKENLMIDEKSIYVVTATSHTDDYKRKYTDVETKTAIDYETAVSIAAYMFLERAQDYDLFCGEEDTLESFAECVNEAGESELAEAVYHFFMSNESLFQGEYVPMTFEVQITEQRVSSVTDSDISRIAYEIIESLEE